MVSPLFEGIEIIGKCVLGMVPQLRFGILFLGSKELGDYLPLCLEVRFLQRYKLVEGRFAKLICLWLMMRLLVASFNSIRINP